MLVGEWGWGDAVAGVMAFEVLSCAFHYLQRGQLAVGCVAVSAQYASYNVAHVAVVYGFCYVRAKRAQAAITASALLLN